MRAAQAASADKWIAEWRAKTGGEKAVVPKAGARVAAAAASAAAPKAPAAGEKLAKHAATMASALLWPAPDRAEDAVRAAFFSLFQISFSL